MLSAVILDFDGTIHNSPEYVYKARDLFFKEFGIEFTKKEKNEFLATPEKEFLSYINKKHNLSIDFLYFQKKIRNKFLEIADLKPNPGVVDFINELIDNDIKIVIASSNNKQFILEDLEIIGIDKNKFDAIVDFFDVIYHKPHPETFLVAAKKLGVDPKNCVGIEDAINGIKSINSAGMKSVGLVNKFTTKEDFLKNNTDLIINSFKDLNVSKLRELVKK